MGDKLNKAAAGNKSLGVGGYALMPAKMNHFAYTTGTETTIVLYGMGPVEFTYVESSRRPAKCKNGDEVEDCGFAPWMTR